LQVLSAVKAKDKRNKTYFHGGTQNTVRQHHHNSATPKLRCGDGAHLALIVAARFMMLSGLVPRKQSTASRIRSVRLQP
jgi:hypothetical protein